MPLAELMSQIQDLSKIDKLRLMQFLATELVKTELVKEEDTSFFVANQEYPVWSPYHCSEAANVLMNLLATKQQEQNG
jgi:fibrillarin-like rRNA methylase